MAAEPSGKQVRLEISWQSADAIEPVFVDHVHLARLNDQFFLTFGQTRVGVTNAEALTRAEIHPMVRLVIPAKSVEKIAQLLASALEGSRP